MSVLRAGLQEIETACLGLQSVNLNGCVTIFRVALEQQPQLERLEASGCKGMRNVISNSSLLRSCFLQSCPRLAVRPQTFLSSELLAFCRVWQPASAQTKH